jgi:hypothetical protein
VYFFTLSGSGVRDCDNVRAEVTYLRRGGARHTVHVDVERRVVALVA